MTEQPPERTPHRILPLQFGYGVHPEQAIQEARRWPGLRQAAFALRGCPVNIDYPGFIKLIAEAKFLEAAALSQGNECAPGNYGPGLSARKPRAKGLCVLCKKYEPVAIGRLERFAADWEASNGSFAVPKLPEPIYKKIALLALGSRRAYRRRRSARARVILSPSSKRFTKSRRGYWFYGIPEFAYPKRLSTREVDYVRSLGGADQKRFCRWKCCNHRELLDRNTMQFFLGTGAGLPWFLGIPGEKSGRCLFFE